MIDEKYKYIANDYEGSKALMFIDGTDDVLVMRRGSTAPNAPSEVDLPGGRAEPGESPWVTVVREVEEEVSINVSGATVLGSHGSVLPNGRKAWIIVLEISDSLATKAVPGPEASEVIRENIDKYLSREDAWKPFQKHAHYLAVELNRTSLEFTPYKSP